MWPKYYTIPPTHRHPASPFLVREPAAELTSAQRQCQPRPLGSGNTLMLSSSFCSCVVAIRHCHRIQTPHFQITSRLGLGPGPKILTCPHSTKPWHPGENRSRCCCINGGSPVEPHGTPSLSDLTIADCGRASMAARLRCRHTAAGR